MRSLARSARPTTSSTSSIRRAQRVAAEVLQPPEELQVLPCRQVRVQRDVLGNQADVGLAACWSGARRARATDPASGSSSPAIIEMVVVLPAPLGPSRPYVSPGRDLERHPSTAVCSPNRRTRSLTSRTGVSTAPGYARGPHIPGRPPTDATPAGHPPTRSRSPRAEPGGQQTAGPARPRPRRRAGR